MAYHGPSNLNFSNNVIKSQTGIRLGDPVGPALFSLEVDDITKSVDAEFNIRFLDDCIDGDSPEKLIKNVHTVVQKLRLAGLELNISKCELTILGHQTTTEVTLTTDISRNPYRYKKTDRFRNYAPRSTDKRRFNQTND